MPTIQLDNSGDDARTRILRAAEALFAAKGFDGTHIRNIAAHAGVTNPVIYHHFKNKQGLFHSILVGASDRLIAAVETTRVNQTRPMEELASVVHVLCRFATEHIDLFRIVYRELADSSMNQASPLGDRLGVLVQLVTGAVRRAIASRACRAVDPHTASLVILGGIEALVGWQRVAFGTTRADALAPDEAAEELIGLLWRGLEVRSVDA